MHLFNKCFKIENDKWKNLFKYELFKFKNL